MKRVIGGVMVMLLILSMFVIGVLVMAGIIK